MCIRDRLITKFYFMQKMKSVPEREQIWAIPNFINTFQAWLGQGIELVQKLVSTSLNQIPQAWWADQKNKGAWEEEKVWEKKPTILEQLKEKYWNKVDLKEYLGLFLTYLDEKNLKELIDEEKLQIIKLILENDIRSDHWDVDDWYIDVVKFTKFLKKEESRLEAIKIFKDILFSNKQIIKEQNTLLGNNRSSEDAIIKKLGKYEDIIYAQIITLKILIKDLKDDKSKLEAIRYCEFDYKKVSDEWKYIPESYKFLNTDFISKSLVKTMHFSARALVF